MYTSTYILSPPPKKKKNNLKKMNQVLWNSFNYIINVLSVVNWIWQNTVLRKTNWEERHNAASRKRGNWIHSTICSEDRTTWCSLTTIIFRFFFFLLLTSIFGYIINPLPNCLFLKFSHTLNNLPQSTAKRKCYILLYPVKFPGLTNWETISHWAFNFI